MVVSIDIGTSYSSICMLGLDGKAHPVDISTGACMFGSKFSLPSAVFVEDSGNVVVGQAALNSRKRKPQNFYMGFKRNLGENIPILLGERSFRPEELYIELFRHMKARAEEVSGERVEKAFLTYPASYGKQRKDKLCAAARTAGLFDLDLVDEPTAAAMCYCAEGYVKDGQTLLVYDFGGGTFDVSLLRYENGGFELLAEPVGLERCGGMDIDYLIASDMREAINKELPGAWDELQKNERRFQRLTSQLSELAVKAKHHLSSAGVFEDYLTVDLDDVNYQITVERFNGMIAPLVGQTIQTCRRALDEAQVSPADVSAVLMVGGTSRIPLVKEMARKITGKPALCAADLELAVAQGALVYHTAPKSAAVTTDELQAWYETGRRSEAEYQWKQALQWYEKAAEQGHALAMFRAARTYSTDGRGIQTNEDLSNMWFSKAAPLLQKLADSGDPEAAYALGWCYTCGHIGEESDEKQAIQWYLKAANGGSVEAMERLSDCYRFGWGVEENRTAAFQWCKRAAETGRISPDGAGSMGFFYQYGEGVKKNSQKANQWHQRAVSGFRKAAEAGDGSAAFGLASCYEHGKGVPEDYRLYKQWLFKAAELGYELSYFYLGMNYERGYNDFPEDRNEALKWYRKATECGDEYCVDKVRELEGK